MRAALALSAGLLAILLCAHRLQNAPTDPATDVQITDCSIPQEQEDDSCQTFCAHLAPNGLTCCAPEHVMKWEPFEGWACAPKASLSVEESNETVNASEIIRHRQRRAPKRRRGEKKRKKSAKGKKDKKGRGGDEDYDSDEPVPGPPTDDEAKAVIDSKIDLGDNPSIDETIEKGSDEDEPKSCEISDEDIFVPNEAYKRKFLTWRKNRKKLYDCKCKITYEDWETCTTPCVSACPTVPTCPSTCTTPCSTTCTTTCTTPCPTTTCTTPCPTTCTTPCPTTCTTPCPTTCTTPCGTTCTTPCSTKTCSTRCTTACPTPRSCPQRAGEYKCH